MRFERRECSPGAWPEPRVMFSDHSAYGYGKFGGLEQGRVSAGPDASQGRSCILPSEAKISSCFALALRWVSVFSITHTTICRSFLFFVPPLFCLCTRPSYTKGIFPWESQTELSV